MTPAGQAVTRSLVVLVGVLLILLGVVHAVVNVRGLHSAAARGQIAERLGHQMIANVVFGGATLALCGAILLLIAFGLRAPRRTLRSIGVLIGLFLAVMGVAAYLYIPIPAVLMFSALGALVGIPLLLWRGAFGSEPPLTEPD